MRVGEWSLTYCSDSLISQMNDDIIRRGFGPEGDGIYVYIYCNISRRHTWVRDYIVTAVHFQYHRSRPARGQLASQKTAVYILKEVSCGTQCGCALINRGPPYVCALHIYAGGSTCAACAGNLHDVAWRLKIQLSCTIFLTSSATHCMHAPLHPYACSVHICMWVCENTRSIDRRLRRPSTYRKIPSRVCHPARARRI